MHSRYIKDGEYEVVMEFTDDGQGNAVAKTIVAEGETPVNTYRLRVASHNPLTLKPFNRDVDALWRYLTTVDDLTWDTYWEDPEEGE